MPRLQVPEKGPRKRRSTTAIREDEESRKKVANVPEGAAGEEEGKEGEEEIDMSDVMAAMYSSALISARSMTGVEPTSRQYSWLALLPVSEGGGLRITGVPILTTPS